MKYIDSDLKPFLNVFEPITRTHGYYYVWDDFLDLFINGFCFNHNINLELIRKKYSQEEQYSFGKMIQEVLFLMEKKIKDDKSWFDFFGAYYEMASLSKQKGFAQFFTPAEVCDLMAQIAMPKGKENISDPCCGSARLSLAANKINLGMFHFLVDLDYTCAKMAALNLMLHGIKGIVICDNSLATPGKEFRGAFKINDRLNVTGVPQIEYIGTAKEAYNYVRFNTWSLEDFTANKIKIEKQEDNFEDVKEILQENGQFALF